MGFLARIIGHPSKSPPLSIADKKKINSNPTPQSAKGSGAARTGPLRNEDKFAFLKELTGSLEHSGKTFYQHLFNVYSHLRSVEATDAVCDAGLFHSIYGTEFYDFQDNRITRDVVRGIIGEYAEELVYIFCTSKDRFNVIVNNTRGLSSQMVIDLCFIEFANVIDQNVGGRYDVQLKKLSETIAAQAELIGVELREAAERKEGAKEGNEQA